MSKGFTLVELLCVILILGILALITVISINPILKDSRNELSDIQIENIEESASLYYVKHGVGLDDFELDNPIDCINVSELIESGYLDNEDVKNPQTGEDIIGSVKITYKSNNYIYEYQDTVCTNYDKGIICERVEETELGNVPEGNFIAGDAYNCKVDPNKEPYKFYILTTPEEDSDMLNLIMAANITLTGDAVIPGVTSDTGVVAWNSSGSNTGGPVDAMQFLYKATKNWTNIVPLNYKYKDREYQSISIDNTTIGYMSFVSNNGVLTITPLLGTSTIIGQKEEPLRARLPIFKYENGIDYGEVSSLKEDYSNAYLYDNLLITDNFLSVGYWTLSSSSYDNSAIYSWSMLYDGGSSIANVSEPNSIGVRPVISVYKFQME